MKMSQILKWRLPRTFYCAMERTDGSTRPVSSLFLEMVELASLPSMLIDATVVSRVLTEALSQVSESQNDGGVQT